MRPARSRRVQAQRKFAQGAYVPPNNVAVAAVNENRRDVAQEARNVTINNMAAADLLNVVAFQGMHTHLQPVVIVNRLGGDNLKRNAPQPNASAELRHQETPAVAVRNPVPSKMPRTRKKKEYKRTHVMSLRSRRLSKQLFRKVSAQAIPRQTSAKRKMPIAPEKPTKSKRKHVSPNDDQLTLSEFSLEDNRPLKYFAKSSSMPVGPAAVAPSKTVPVASASPEPVAGPSGLQISVGPSALSNAGTASSRTSYYSDHNIIQCWINNASIEEFSPAATPNSMRLRYGTPVPCQAAEWCSVQDVVNAPKEKFDTRCGECSYCQRISKLIKVSNLLKSQLEFDLTGNEPIETINTSSAMISPDAENGHLYLDLLPKHPSIMMKLRINMVHGKQVLSACLVPRTDARKNKEDFLLEEQEHLLDQLIETLMLSLNDQPEKISKDETGHMQSDEIHHNHGRGKISAPDIYTMMKKQMEAELTRMPVTRDLEKGAEAARIVADNTASVPRNEAEKEAEISRIEAELRTRIRAEVEAEVRMMAEVDEQAKALDKEKDAKVVHPHSSDQDPNAPGCSGSQQAPEGGKLIDAPIFHPTEEEFKDPVSYFEKIGPEASNYGICKVVPPPGWRPKCKLPEDMRFDVTNQYISRLFSRWGPAARELCAIRMCLQLQKMNFTRPPVLDGVEVNLSKLYHLVQRYGGLEMVINRKKWSKVVEDIHFNKLPATERKLDQIYVKYLLPYDTLSHNERQEIMRIVEKAWQRKYQTLLDRAMNPLHRQKKMIGLSDSSSEDTEDEDTARALNEAEDCIIHGATTTRSKFKKAATITYETVFGPGSEAEGPPPLAKIEERYWRLVLLGTEHLCVHTSAIDTGEEGYGFTKNRNEAGGKHPWNLKNLASNQRNVLRHLGSVLGVTVPTLHLGMLFSTSCWHKDPHALSWMEYQHIGPTRIWYGIPSDQSDNFRKAVETLCPTSCQNKMMWLPSDISMIPPSILREHNVNLTRLTQEETEFVIIFPKAYTCCISTGYTVSESVYFAPPSWLKYIPHVLFQTRESCEPTMFSIEQLLFLVAKNGEIEELEIIQPIYDQMLREEVTNRQMLQERGLKFVHETTAQEPTTSRRRRHNIWNARDQEECEYCRTTLFLSKVKGLVTKNTSLCLEHALKLLDTPKYKNVNVSLLEVFVYVSVKELNKVGDDMKCRLVGGRS